MFRQPTTRLLRLECLERREVYSTASPMTLPFEVMPEPIPTIEDAQESSGEFRDSSTDQMAESFLSLSESLETLASLDSDRAPDGLEAAKALGENLLDQVDEMLGVEDPAIGTGGDCVTRCELDVTPVILPTELPSNIEIIIVPQVTSFGTPLSTSTGMDSVHAPPSDFVATLTLPLASDVTIQSTGAAVVTSLFNFDDDGNGIINHYITRFSDAVNDATFTPGFAGDLVFQLNGLHSSDAAIPADVADDDTIYLQFIDASHIENEIGFVLLTGKNEDADSRRLLTFVLDTCQSGVRGPEAGERWCTSEYNQLWGDWFFIDETGSDTELDDRNNSSCWIRVSQVHAGQGFGGIDIPRIGQDVIVDLVEGDPDRPIIIGRVYHAENMPPLGLPGSKNISGLKSNGTNGGGGYNEFVLDDTKGSELIREHGQFDKDSTIENDLREHVLHDRSRDVTNNESIPIGGDRTEDVGNNETLTVGSERTRAVGKNETITVALTRTHSAGVNETISVGGAQE